VVSGSNLRWPLWPENPTRKDRSLDTLIGSIEGTNTVLVC
jgi:hypothetical protein